MIRVLVFWLMVVPWASSVYGQVLINATGKSITNGGITIDYSIGEIATITLQNGTKTITQGFLQPNYQIMTAVNNVFDRQFSFKAYPNPVTEQLLIETDYADFENMEIYDAAGKQLLKAPFDYKPLELSHLTSGVYFIHLKSKQFAKTVKIIKK